MVPVGTSPGHHGNGIVSQADLFVYKARECKSAPARTIDITDMDSVTSRNSSAIARKKTTKHISLSWKTLVQFFGGHAPKFTTWTTSFKFSSSAMYYSLFFVETILRSIGDVTFCSNPFSGLMILLGMLISCPQVVLLANLTVIFGLITAIGFLQIPMEEVRGGSVLWNNYLTGTVVALLADKKVICDYPDIIGICMAAGILTVIVWKFLSGIFASHLEFPLLNASFHIMILLYIFSGIASRYKPEETLQIHDDKDLPISLKNGSELLDNFNGGEILNILGNGTGQMHLLERSTVPASAASKHLYDDSSSSLIKSNAYKQQSFDWIKMLFGIALAPSRVFGTTNIFTSMMVYFGIFIYSPIMFLQSVTGVTIGTMMGIMLCSPAEYETIYVGSWGYNPLFTSAALGGFFLIFNVHSWLLSIAGSILTTLLYSAMIKCHVPALGIPFMATTWLLLPSIPYLRDSISTEDFSLLKIGSFYRLRLSQITTPELHRHYLIDESNDSNDKYRSQRPPTAIPQPSNIVLPL